MNLNPALSLKEQYGPKSQAWQEQQSPHIVRFWCDDGACWGIPFHQVLGTHYNPKHESLLIQFALGTIVVTGPKAWDFYDRQQGNPPQSRWKRYPGSHNSVIRWCGQNF